MTLTQDERDQVVELLRCAADVDVHSENALDTLGIVIASWNLWLRDEATFEPSDVVRTAERAWRNVCRDLCIVWPDRTHQDAYRLELLEAAQRVEEGSWP